MSEATSFSADKLYLPQPIIDEAVMAALKEDLGRAGDITTLATIPETAHAKAVIASREDGVVSGIPLAESAFRQIGKWHGEIVTFSPQMEDGTEIHPGDVVARIFGPARLVLSAERIALNFMGRMSGIATSTHQFVKLTEGTNAKIACTRKTIPGMRAFEKYAVKCGGGSNHRFGLDDAILIKDNHIAVAGSVTEAIRRSREYVGHLVKVEVEVDTLDQLKEAIACKPDVIMLDNMGPEKLREALALMEGTGIVSEASGGVSPETVKAVAATGVDFISTGYITHSAPNFDLGLDISVS